MMECFRRFVDTLMIFTGNPAGMFNITGVQGILIIDGPRRPQGFLVLSLLVFMACKPEKPRELISDPPKNVVRADRYEVTVAQFREFITSTGHITTADSFAWSGVFDTILMDWKIVEGANWEHHDGHTIAEDIMPVVHVSYFDACAYCKWKNGRLPSADEWDLIAGDTVITGNVWQGLFPYVDKGDDGYRIKAAPVGQFTPNISGYYDLFGNVWEWTSSIHRGKGERIIKGGSFLCDYNVCQGYIPSRFQTTADDSGLNHLGFRCVYDP